MSFPLVSSDFAAGEDPAKVAAALARFTVREAVTRADFDLGYRLLDAQFGAANELERYEVLSRWFELGSLSPPDAAVVARYHLLLFFDADGQVAAVRDGFTALDRAAKRIVALMSHSLVLPAWRRTGVATLLRASPATLCRMDADFDPEVEGTLVAEMEPVEPELRDTVIRLMAYGRAGFRVIPPWWVAYAQPDFRDTEALQIPYQPIPFLLLVRQLGAEDRETVAWDRVAAILDHLAAIHGPSIDAAQLLEIRANALRRRGDAPIPLITPPRELAQVSALAPLLRSVVLPHFPPRWHGDRPAGDPEADRLALSATWSTS